MISSQTTFVIHNICFTSGKEIRKFINQNIRNKYSTNEPLNRDDQEFLKEIFSYIYCHEYLNSIEAIVLDHYGKNKVFCAVISQKKYTLSVSKAIDKIVSQKSLIFTSSKTGGTLRIYPHLGKENYSKCEGTWEVTADRQIQDADTLEKIGILNPTSFHKISKWFKDRDYPYTISGKIDIFPSLIFTSDQSGNTLKIISNTNSAKGLTYQGRWVIKSNGEAIDDKTHQAIGHLDQDSFQKIAKQLKESRQIKVTGKTENFTSFVGSRQDALRATIRPQIEDYKQKQKQQYPDFDFSNYQVDHEDPTFAEIVEDWMLKFNLTWEDLKLSYKNCSMQLVEEEQAKSFYNYHKEVAKLKYIPAEKNLKKSKPGNNIYINS
jgi:hypothetical protein